MGVHELQEYLVSENLDGGAVPVDLLKIARTITHRQQPHNLNNRKICPIGSKLKLLVDAEHCLHRLYGGFYSDWACGGQWNRMMQFLSLLTRAAERGNIEITVVFNSTIDTSRMDEWRLEQASIRQKAGLVLKHIHMRGTPPPKVWWITPTGLSTALRLALRHLGVQVICTMDDHHQEVIAYCRESGFHGLVADDAEYAAFDPPRYFSSENLKLTYKGSIETKEYMISELTKTLQITQAQLCVLASLLGNFLIPPTDLQDIYHKIGIQPINAKDTKLTIEKNLKLLADYIRNLPPPSNMKDLLAAIFQNSNDGRGERLQKSIHYYLNGTANGFLKYCASSINTTAGNSVKQKKNHGQIENVSEFASETCEQQEETLQNYKMATVNYIMSTTDYNLDETTNGVLMECQKLAAGLPQDTPPPLNGLVNGSSANNGSLPSSPKHPVPLPVPNIVVPNVSFEILRTASLRHQRGLMSSYVLHVLSTQEIRLPCLLEDESNREFPPIHEIYLTLRKRVYAVLFNLHHLRYVYYNTKKESSASSSPSGSTDGGPPDVLIKEWIYSRSNPYQYAETVKSEPLPWAVPTVQRLWYGTSVEDKKRRLRALLSCLNSDSPLILNTSYVPQHMLIMACVLRYIMAQEKPILKRNELDSFLCQAFNPDLMNPQYLQELQLSVVTSRGVQLAALFMQGIEMALFTNDACGAPIPWLMCCPWLYFDGKLFHYTLNRSAHSKNILEVCENHIERVVKVERMRKAILEGLDVKFHKMLSLPFSGMVRPGMPLSPTNRVSPAGMRSGPPPSSGGVRSGGGGVQSSRGGQLQIAGVVVGSWGANYGYQSNNNANHRQQLPPPPPTNHQQQHYFSGGPYGIGRGRPLPPPQQQQQQQLPSSSGGPSTSMYTRTKSFPGAGQRRLGPPTFTVNTRRFNNTNNVYKKRTNKIQNSTSKPPTTVLTVKTDRGDVPADQAILEDNKILIRERSTDSNSDSNEPHKGQGDSNNSTNEETKP